MKKGDCFAIRRGRFATKFIIYLGAYGKQLQFLMMPGDFQILSISEGEFEFARRDSSVEGVPPFIEFIENLPDYVFEVIEAQYNELKKSGKRPITTLVGSRT